MTTQTASWRDAVRLALRAEDEAAHFYAGAAEKTQDPRGRDMFLQLADFERAHYRHLQRLLDTAVGAAFDEYPGAAFGKIIPGLPTEKLGKSEAQTDLDALETAILAEKTARQAYFDLAESTTDPAVRRMFLKLADEEDLHRRILEDQSYALSNRGVWIWGD